MAFKSKTADAQANTDRESATKASDACPFCNRQGVVTVYHPTFSGNSVEVTKEGRQYAATTAAHCRCELGAWIRDHSLPEVQARVPRVEDICRGRSTWLLIPPGERDQPDSAKPVDRAAFAAFWRKVESGRMLKHPNEGAPRKPRIWETETALRERVERLTKEEVTT